MTVLDNPSLTIASTREGSWQSFQSGVRNSLGRLANLVGLDPSDRDELMDLAHSDRAWAHWRRLLEENSGSSGHTPEHIWNHHVRAATRDCVAHWGQI